MSGVVALVGRLVDITATLTGLSFQPTDTDTEQLRILSMTVAVIRTDLTNRRISRVNHFHPDHAPSPYSVIERNAKYSFAHPSSIRAFRISESAPATFAQYAAVDTPGTGCIRQPWAS